MATNQQPSDRASYLDRYYLGPEALGALADFRTGREAYSVAALDYVEIVRSDLLSRHGGVQ